jgi:hypothetical protein
MDRFYQTMHSLNEITYTDLDHVLCRLTHNVIYIFIIEILIFGLFNR